MRRHAAHGVRLFHVLRVAEHGGHPGRLLQSVGERVADSPRIELEQRGSRRRGAEYLPGCARMSPCRHELPRIESRERSRAHVVAKHDGGQQIPAGALVLLGHGERRRKDARSRMRASGRVRVIGLVGVAARPVGERRIEHGGDVTGADARRLRAFRRAA